MALPADADPELVGFESAGAVLVIDHVADGESWLLQCDTTTGARERSLDLGRDAADFQFSAD